MHFFHFLLLKNTYILIMHCLCKITKEMISKDSKKDISICF